MIRAARPGDVAALAALEEEAFAGAAWNQAQLESDIGRSAHTVLVAEREGQVVGYAVTAIAGDIADLTRIAVTGSARRRGIASALLAASLTEATRAGADRMLLEVAAENAGALDFYRARGFSEISRRRRYYADGGDALVLARALG